MGARRGRREDRHISARLFGGCKQNELANGNHVINPLDLALARRSAVYRTGRFLQSVNALTSLRSCRTSTSLPHCLAILRPARKTRVVPGATSKKLGRLAAPVAPLALG